MGRSNVGKSSLLNAIVRQPGLAFISSRPGCTQLINFYRVDEAVRFVDLPGYGYAQVSLEERAQWKHLIESYLLSRESLALSFLLLDARRGWLEKDLELRSWLEFHNRRQQVVVTSGRQAQEQEPTKNRNGCNPKAIGRTAGYSVLGHRWPGSEGNLANHLEDQEQAVAPAAVTADAPNEKPQEVNGEGKPAADASPASDEKTSGPEAKDPKTEKPASRPKTAESKGNGKAAADAKPPVKPPSEMKALPAAEQPAQIAAAPPPPQGATASGPAQTQLSWRPPRRGL